MTRPTRGIEGKRGRCLEFLIDGILAECQARTNRLIHDEPFRWESSACTCDAKRAASVSDPWTGAGLFTDLICSTTCYANQVSSSSLGDVVKRV